MLTKYGTNQSLIANLGHGIYPDMSPDHLMTYIDSVHQLSSNNN